MKNFKNGIVLTIIAVLAAGGQQAEARSIVNYTKFPAVVTRNAWGAAGKNFKVAQASGEITTQELQPNGIWRLTDHEANNTFGILVAINNVKVPKSLPENATWDRLLIRKRDGKFIIDIE